MDIRTHIESAVRILGSQTKLADAIGCSQQQISYLLRAKAVTAEMAMAIDKATAGQVPRQVLRPDIFGHPPAHGDTAQPVQPPARKRGAA